jgi:hypothetical protein
VREAAGGSEATITSSHTSLGPEGDAFLAEFTEDYYKKFMRDWETRMSYFLTNGSALTGTSG